MDTVRCASCGKQNDPGDSLCIHCGQPVDAAASSAPAWRVDPPPLPPSPALPAVLPATSTPPPTTPVANGLATAGLVVGVLGVVLFWFPGVGFILAILAVVFGALGIGRANLGAGGKGQAVAALVLGVIGIILPLLVLSAILDVGTR